MTLPLDVLVLGPFVFDVWATPEQLPFGGAHQFNVKMQMGGDRIIDAMGPNDANRSFSGIHKGVTALDDSLTLDAMRSAGLPLAYSNGVEARTVVIVNYKPEVEKFSVIHFTIELMTIDNPNGDQGTSSPDSLISDDTITGQAIISTNAVSSYLSAPTTPTTSGGIGSA